MTNYSFAVAYKRRDDNFMQVISMHSSSIGDYLHRLPDQSKIVFSIHASYTFNLPFGDDALIHHIDELNKDKDGNDFIRRHYDLDGGSYTTSRILRSMMSECAPITVERPWRFGGEN